MNCNDENVIVSQLHGLFIRFHNLVVQENPKLAFSDIQQIVRWHYQWAILHDYGARRQPIFALVVAS